MKSWHFISGLTQASGMYHKIGINNIRSLRSLPHQLGHYLWLGSKSLIAKIGLDCSISLQIDHDPLIGIVNTHWSYRKLNGCAHFACKEATCMLGGQMKELPTLSINSGLLFSAWVNYCWSACYIRFTGAVAACVAYSYLSHHQTRWYAGTYVKEAMIILSN